MPDKNTLITGTISFSDVENKADYKSSNFGTSYDSAASNDEDGVLGDKGLIPVPGMPAGGSDSSTTKSAVAAGTINITDKAKQKQDVNDLNRNTDNTLNKLGEIFDKESVQERQEMANLFGELAYNQVHNMKGSEEEKAAWHALIGGIMSTMTGGDFLSGATPAAVNKLLTTELEKAAKKDPAMQQWLSAGLGAVVGSMAGNAETGASVSASGTKNNGLNHPSQNNLAWSLNNAANNTAAAKILDNAIIESINNKLVGEQMEQSVIDALNKVAKQEGIGVKFVADPNARLTNNLISARAFINMDTYLKHLPYFFETGVILTASAIAAPVPIAAGVLKYGGAIYDLKEDISKDKMDDFKYDLSVNTAFLIGNSILEPHIPSKTILILGEAGIRTYIKREREY